MEILVVVAIIAILISIVIPATSFARRRARQARAGSEIAAVERAFDEFKIDHGYYPPKPTPTRTLPDGPYGFNFWIWYALVTYDLDRDGNPDTQDTKKLGYLDYTKEKFNSDNLLVDPWDTPYGILLPADPRGWDTTKGETGWPKGIRIWSNGANTLTTHDNPGMEEDDIRNASYGE